MDYVSKRKSTVTRRQQSKLPSTSLVPVLRHQCPRRDIGFVYLRPPIFLKKDSISAVTLHKTPVPPTETLLLQQCPRIFQTVSFCLCTISKQNRHAHGSIFEISLKKMMSHFIREFPKENSLIIVFLVRAFSKNRC